MLATANPGPARSLFPSERTWVYRLLVAETDGRRQRAATAPQRTSTVPPVCAIVSARIVFLSLSAS